MSLPSTMKAVVTTGNGGFDKLSYQDVPVPAAGKALLPVLAAGQQHRNQHPVGLVFGGVNRNLDRVRQHRAPDAGNVSGGDKEDGSWAGKAPFPLIQGTDCCGEVVELGQGADPALLGRRAVRANMRRHGPDNSNATGWPPTSTAPLPSSSSAGFEVFPVDCDGPTLNWRPSPVPRDG